MTLLKINNLEYRLSGGRTLFDGLGFEIKPSGGLLIFGPNGSGKTTLVKLILGLIKNYRGDVAIMGKSWRGLNEAQRTAQRGQLGFIMQEPVVFEDLSLVDNISIYLNLAKKRIPRKVIMKNLYKNGFSGLQKKKVGSLSWGQIRMLEMLRIVMKSPQLVICDQPFAALDEDKMIWLADKLNALINSGSGVIVTYSLPKVRNYLDWPQIRLSG